MPDLVDPKAFLTLVKLAINNMYELEALGELLEKKGLLTKQEIIALAKDLKRKNPPAEPTDPTQQPFTKIENAVIEEVMEVNLKHGLSADHAKVLLARTIHLWCGALRSPLLALSSARCPNCADDIQSRYPHSPSIASSKTGAIRSAIRWWP